MEKITLGTLASELSSLIWVAKNKGYFAEQGLDVDIKLYESGLAAFNDMMAGNVEFATADEFVAVRHILEGSDFRIIASIDEAGDVKVVSRKDHGITKITDLKGKRIGLVQGTDRRSLSRSLAAFAGNLSPGCADGQFESVRAVEIYYKRRS